MRFGKRQRIRRVNSLVLQMLGTPGIARVSALARLVPVFIYEARGACGANENILSFSWCLYLAPENDLLIVCLANYRSHFPPQEIAH